MASESVTERGEPSRNLIFQVFGVAAQAMDPVEDRPQAFAQVSMLVSIARDKLGQAVGYGSMDANDAYLCEQALEAAGILIDALGNEKRL